MSKINIIDWDVNNISFVHPENIDLKIIKDTGCKIGGWVINEDSQIDIHTEAKDPD